MWSLIGPFTQTFVAFTSMIFGFSSGLTFLFVNVTVPSLSVVVKVTFAVELLVSSPLPTLTNGVNPFALVSSTV